MDFYQVFLVEADQLPPGHAGDEDEEDVKRHHAEVDLVEARALEVTLTEVDRARAAGVFRNAPHNIGEDTEADRDHQSRSAAADSHRAERDIHGSHVAGSGSEDVVKVDVSEAENDEGDEPIRADKLRRDRRGHPLDEAKLRETAGEGDDDAEPDHGVPGRLFRKHVLPLHSAGDQEVSHHAKADRVRVVTRKHRGRPADEGEDETNTDQLLLVRQSAKLTKHLLPKSLRFRRLIKGGLHEELCHVREDDEADGGGEESGPEPGAPADIHTETFLREVRAERVRCHTGEEERARDRRELKARHDQVVTDLFTGLTRGGTHHVVN